MDYRTPPPIPGSHEQLSPDAATGFTTTEFFNRADAGFPNRRPMSAELARVGVSAQSIRYTTDGTTPTAALGILVPVNTSFDVEGYDAIKAFRCIGTVAGAKVDVIFYGK